ncbi:MAG: pyridoxine/pyridoxamine 5'-phosphate oxidase, partial [Angustibacter sp.]
MSEPIPSNPASSSTVDPTERLDYAGDLLPDELTGSPLDWLSTWFRQAADDPRIVEPGAMVIATVDRAGRPNARTVLLKGLHPTGLSFFTNTESTKGQELAAEPWASAVLLWHPMYRQVRIRGPVTALDPEAARDYFASRPRGSQIATRASQQSQPIASRAELARQVAVE